MSLPPKTVSAVRPASLPHVGEREAERRRLLRRGAGVATSQPDDERRARPARRHAPLIGRPPGASIHGASRFASVKWARASAGAPCRLQRQRQLIVGLARSRRQPHRVLQLGDGAGGRRRRAACSVPRLSANVAACRSAFFCVEALGFGQLRGRRRPRPRRAQHLAEAQVRFGRTRIEADRAPESAMASAASPCCRRTSRACSGPRRSPGFCASAARSAARGVVGASGLPQHDASVKCASGSGRIELDGAAQRRLRRREVVLLLERGAEVVERLGVARVAPRHLAEHLDGAASRSPLCR